MPPRLQPSLFSSLVDSRRIAAIHGMRSQQLIRGRPEQSFVDPPRPTRSDWKQKTERLFFPFFGVGSRRKAVPDALGWFVDIFLEIKPKSHDGS